MDRLPISPAGGGRALLAKFIAPHFTFPDGGLSFLNSATVTITLPAGGAGVNGMVSVCASNRLFGS